MKQILTLLTILALYSCSQQTQQSETTPTNVSINESAISTDSFTENAVENNRPNLDSDDWKNYQDSLRKEILKGKENKILKESFFQEMYIRNVITTSKDSLFVKIEFDVHGTDCGAPDCYSTDVRFSMKLDESLKFPKNLPFQEHEHGCVDKELKLSDSFNLIEETESHVIYYSTKHKRTLVLFSSNKENGTTAFYFIGLAENRINGQNVNSIMEEFNDQNENSIYPFTSWRLSTFDYANFLP